MCVTLLDGPRSRLAPCLQQCFMAGLDRHANFFAINRQNHARRDRRGFSINTKCGLSNRRPKKVSILNFD